MFKPFENGTESSAIYDLTLDYQRPAGIAGSQKIAGIYE